VMDVYSLSYIRQLPDGNWASMFIGVYSSLKRLEEAQERLRRLRGFRDSPEGFRVQCYRMDEEYDDPGFFTPWLPPQPGLGTVLGEAIGVETVAAPFTVLLPRGKRLPASYSGVYSTNVVDQPAVTVNVVAGDPSPAGAARQPAQLVVSGLPAAQAGLLQIHLSLAADEQGAVSASARYAHTGAVLSTATGVVAVDRGGQPS